MTGKGALTDGSPEGRSGRAIEPKHISEVLSAVSAANEHLLVSLRESAFRNELSFPLPAIVRRRFIEIPRAQLREAAQCGVLLVDARCAQVTCECSIAQGSPEPPSYWDKESGTQRAVALAYSLLTAVWYVVHTTPAAASLLLGVSASVVEAFRDLGVGKLALVARREPGWVQPRWRDRPDVWMGLLETRDAGDSPPPSIILRCLKASAASSPGLLRLIEAST